MPSPLLSAVKPVPRRLARPAQGPRVLVVANPRDPGPSLGPDLRALAQAGYRCTVLAAEERGEDDVEVVPRDAALWRFVRSRLQARAYSLIHADGLAAAGHAWVGGFGLGVPMAVSLPAHLHPSSFAGLTGQARRWLLGRVLAQAAAIIAPGDDALANLLRVFPNLRRARPRVHVVPTALDLRRADLPSCDPRDELELDHDTTLIGCLAGAGLPLLLEAVHRLVRHGGVSAFHVIVWDDDARGTKHGSIEFERVADCVSYRSPSLDEVSRVDLVVALSPWDAPVTHLMEALAAGVPVLAPDSPAVRDLLEETPARTFRAGEVASLETGLREALTYAWTDAARAYAPLARQRFDPRVSARLLVALYDQLAGQTNAATSTETHP